MGEGGTGNVLGMGKEWKGWEGRGKDRKGMEGMGKMREGTESNETGDWSSVLVPF